jgi:hypothetical protein
MVGEVAGVRVSVVPGGAVEVNIIGGGDGVPRNRRRLLASECEELARLLLRGAECLDAAEGRPSELESLAALLMK